MGQSFISEFDDFLPLPALLEGVHLMELNHKRLKMDTLFTKVGWHPGDDEVLNVHLC